MQMNVRGLLSDYDNITGFIHIEYNRTDKSSPAAFGEKHPQKSASGLIHIFIRYYKRITGIP